MNKVAQVKSKTIEQLRRIAESSIAKYGIKVSNRTETATYYRHGNIPLFRIHFGTYNNVVNGKFVHDLPVVLYSFMNGELWEKLHLANLECWFVSHDGRVADFVLQDLEKIKKHFENPWVISVFREDNGWASTIGPFKSKEEAKDALPTEVKIACKKYKASIGPRHYHLKKDIAAKGMIAEITNGYESIWFFVGQMITPTGNET